MRGSLAVALLLAVPIASAMSGVQGDQYEIEGTSEFNKDACDACGYFFDYLDEQLKKPIGNVPNKMTKEQYAKSELRAVELLESDLCKETFGATQRKCKRFMEEHEEELTTYIRKGQHTTSKRKQLCHRSCNLPVTEEFDKEYHAGAAAQSPGLGGNNRRRSEPDPPDEPEPPEDPSDPANRDIATDERIGVILHLNRVGKALFADANSSDANSTDGEDAPPAAPLNFTALETRVDAALASYETPDGPDFDRHNDHHHDPIGRHHPHSDYHGHYHPHDDPHNQPESVEKRKANVIQYQKVIATIKKKSNGDLAAARTYMQGEAERLDRILSAREEKKGKKKKGGSKGPKFNVGGERREELVRKRNILNGLLGIDPSDGHGWEDHHDPYYDSSRYAGGEDPESRHENYDHLHTDPIHDARPPHEDLDIPSPPDGTGEEPLPEPINDDHGHHHSHDHHHDHHHEMPPMPEMPQHNFDHHKTAEEHIAEARAEIDRILADIKKDVPGFDDHRHRHHRPEPPKPVAANDIPDIPVVDEMPTEEPIEEGGASGTVELGEGTKMKKGN